MIWTETSIYILSTWSNLNVTHICLVSVVNHKHYHTPLQCRCPIMTTRGPWTLVPSPCDINFFQFAVKSFVPIWASLRAWQGICASIENYVALCTHLYLSGIWQALWSTIVTKTTHIALRLNYVLTNEGTVLEKDESSLWPLESYKIFISTLIVTLEMTIFHDSQLLTGWVISNPIE